MKLLYAVGAFSLSLLAQAGYSQSLVTITVPGTPGCTITGVTSLTASGTNTFSATGGTATGSCGTTQTGQNPPVFAVDKTSITYHVGGGNDAIPQVTWSATPAVSCKASQTSSTVFNNFTFTGAFPASATAAATQELCTAGAVANTCGGTVTATPTAGASVPSANSLMIKCTAPDNSTQSTSVSISLQPFVPNSSCDEGNTGDVAGFTRSCSGSVSYSYSGSPYGGPLDQFAQVFGAWPGTTSLIGQSAIFSLAKTKYLSLAFTPTTATTLKFTANISWGMGGGISISTTQGSMLKGSPGYICGQAFGGSNSLAVSSNNTASAQCKLTPGTTYYMNFANINSSGGAACTKTACNMAYTMTKVN